MIWVTVQGPENYTLLYILLPLSLLLIGFGTLVGSYVYYKKIKMSRNEDFVSSANPRYLSTVIKDAI